MKKFDYKKFYEMYFEQDVDPAPQDIAEIFNICVEDVHKIGGILTLLESMKGLEQISSISVKRIIDSNIITVDELSAELGVSSQYIRELYNQAV